MTVVAGVARQSKVRQDNMVVDVTTLQANYDRLWLHVRITYVLLAALTASYLFAAYATFGTHRRHVVASQPTTAAALDSAGVAWRNLSSAGVEDGVRESGRPATDDALTVDRRRRRSTSRHHRLSGRQRAARDASSSSSSWISHDDSTKHDAGGLWMTMHSKIPVYS